MEAEQVTEQVTYPVKMAVLVRALRNAFGMSQSYLAEQSRSSRPTVNRIETMDKRSPRSDTLENLLQVFRARGVEIMVGDEEINIRFTRKALLDAGHSIAASSDSRGTAASLDSNGYAVSFDRKDTGTMPTQPEVDVALRRK